MLHRLSILRSENRPAIEPRTEVIRAVVLEGSPYLLHGLFSPDTTTQWHAQSVLGAKEMMQPCLNAPARHLFGRAEFMCADIMPTKR